MKMNEEKIFELQLMQEQMIVFYEDYYQIYTNKDEIYDGKKYYEEEISNFISTEIEWVPINKIRLNEEDKQKLFKFLEILEEDDDVQNAFTNAV